MHTKTAAKTETYEFWSMGEGAKVFLTRFDDILRLLNGRDTVVLFLGMGLGGEELIVSRLLSEASGSAVLGSLEVAEPLDPLYRLVRRGIRPLRIPSGLVASSQTRALAMFALLEHVVQNAFMRTDNKSPLLRLLEQERTSAGFTSPAPRGERLIDTFPRIIAVGQTSVNRVVGLEHGVTEEAAYSPREGTWQPVNVITSAKSVPSRVGIAPLATVEVGGQAMVPTLVWDALRIPCALASNVADDEFGEQVLNRLKLTEWIDFHAVRLQKRSDDRLPCICAGDGACDGRDVVRKQDNS